MKELPWVIVGLGRVGRALCVLAGRQGIDVRATWTRADAEPLTALAGELAGAAVFVTVSDGAIAEVADELAPLCAEAALVVNNCAAALVLDATQRIAAHWGRSCSTSQSTIFSRQSTVMFL